MRSRRDDIELDPEVGVLLDDLVPAILGALGDEVVAIYLWGSATLGGYRFGRSDVDLLVCTRHEPDEALLRRVQPLHDRLAAAQPRWVDRVEVAYVEAAALRTFRERPHDIVRISPGEPLNVRIADAQWLIDWYQVREHGVALHGPAPRELVPLIDGAELRAEAGRQLLGWRDRLGDDAGTGYRASVVLAVARGVHAVELGRQASKQDAARWLAGEQSQWAATLDAAIRIHEQGPGPGAPVLGAQAVRRLVAWAATIVPRPPETGDLAEPEDSAGLDG